MRPDVDKFATKSRGCPRPTRAAGGPLAIISYHQDGVTVLVFAHGLPVGRVPGFHPGKPPGNGTTRMKIFLLFALSSWGSCLWSWW